MLPASFFGDSLFCRLLLANPLLGNFSLPSPNLCRDERNVRSIQKCWERSWVYFVFLRLSLIEAASSPLTRECFVNQKWMTSQSTSSRCGSNQRQKRPVWPLILDGTGTFWWRRCLICKCVGCLTNLSKTARTGLSAFTHISNREWRENVYQNGSVFYSRSTCVLLEIWPVESLFNPLSFLFRIIYFRKMKSFNVFISLIILKR